VPTGLHVCRRGGDPRTILYDGDRDYWGLRDLADLVTVVRGAWEVAFFEGARRAIQHRLRTGTEGEYMLENVHRFGPSCFHVHFHFVAVPVHNFQLETSSSQITDQYNVVGVSGWPTPGASTTTMSERTPHYSRYVLQNQNSTESPIVT
jgi:hypothetical protein